MAIKERMATERNTGADGVVIGGISFTVTRKEHRELRLGGDNGAATIGAAIDELYKTMVLANGFDSVVTGVSLELTEEHAAEMSRHIVEEYQNHSRAV